MATNSAAQALFDEIETTKFALRELLVMRETIAADRLKTSHLPRVDRKLARAYRSLSRQTVGLSSDLMGLGLGSREISELIAEAKEQAKLQVSLLA